MVIPPLQQAAPPQLVYVDRPEISETLVDSLEKLFFDGFSARIELVVNRLDHPQPPKPPTGQKVTASRLILSLPSLVNLAQQLNGFVMGLQQQGIIKQVTPGSDSHTLN